MPKIRKHRIFVLEDDRVSRKLITHCLDDAGYESIECPEGKDALHGAELWPPTVMIVDVMLPDMQGTDLVALLREDTALRDIRIIFLTGILKGKPVGNEHRFKIGDEFFPALAKPINFPQLLDLVAREVGTAQIIKEKRAQLAAEAAIAAKKENDDAQDTAPKPLGFPEKSKSADPSSDADSLEYERGKSSEAKSCSI